MFSRTPRNSLGFTLIELLVVLGTIGILSSVGIASFVSYNRSQVLNNARADLLTALNLAKSRSLSQVKELDGVILCQDNDPLQGYELRICSLPEGNCTLPDTSYEVHAVCQVTSPATPIHKNKLPEQVVVDEASSTASRFLFRVVTGDVINSSQENPDTISLNYGEDEETILVYPNGRIQ